MQNGTATVESGVAGPQNLNTEPPRDPEIPPLGIYPEELRAGS